LAHFVIDHNFPQPVLNVRWPPSIQLAKVIDFDRRLVRDHEDWEIFLELDRRGGVDGYITNDAKVLNSATEMVALSTTNLTLIVTDDTGHTPIEAMGLLMAYLRQIAARVSARSEIYVLRVGDVARHRASAREYIRRIAKRKYDRMISEETARMSTYQGPG